MPKFCQLRNLNERVDRYRSSFWALGTYNASTQHTLVTGRILKSIRTYVIGRRKCPIFLHHGLVILVGTNFTLRKYVPTFYFHAILSLLIMRTTCNVHPLTCRSENLRLQIINKIIIGIGTARFTRINCLYVRLTRSDYDNSSFFLHSKSTPPFTFSHERDRRPVNNYDR